MTNANINPGNRLILYLRTDQMNEIRKTLEATNYSVEKEIHQNPNTLKLEFSVRDPDGYYWTITDYHNY